MLLKIVNFKSIEDTTLKLAPLTVLLGPPASGKSNILDAIALIGYFNRLLLLDREYDNNAANLEPLTFISRFDQHQQLFRNHDLSEKIFIEANIDNEEKLRLAIWYSQGRINVKLNETIIPWDLRSLPQGPFQDVRNSLNKIAEGKLFLETRLYGYDRYGLASSICTAPTICGFHLHLKGVQVRLTPKNVLSEFGWNATTIMRMIQDIIVKLNEVSREYMNEKIEIKVLRSGNIIIFDYDYDIEPLGVSDSIFRILYYLMAIRTATNYAKLYGLEKKFILLMEEPEAHIFPYYLDILVDYINKVKNVLYVVIATHNPILISMLWDKIKEIKTYYVTREEYGSTKAWEVNIEELAEELKTSEDLLSMPPHEILSRYIMGTSHAELAGSKPK